MDFLELCIDRESCRNFTGEPVPADVLDKIVEAGRLAPSACNSQPWHFFVVESGENVEEMRKGLQIMGMNKFTDKASAFVVVSGEKENYMEAAGKVLFGKDFSNIDIGITVATMAMCARSLGYGSCIIGSFSDGLVKKAAGIKNKAAKIKLVLALGVSADSAPRPKKRKTKEEVVTYVNR